MFHLLISSSHKRLLCLPMSPCFPLRLSKKWGGTVKVIFMIIFKSLYLRFIFQKMVCVILFLFFLLLFFRFYPILKRNKGINFSVIVLSLCCSLPLWPWLSLNWFVINPWKDDDEVINISKSYIMWTAGWGIIWNSRSSQLQTQLLQLRKESLKKIQACTGFECLCDTGAAFLPIELTGNWFIFLIRNQWVAIYPVDSPIHLITGPYNLESVIWPSSAFAAQ